MLEEENRASNRVCHSSNSSGCKLLSELSEITLWVVEVCWTAQICTDTLSLPKLGWTPVGNTLILGCNRDHLLPSLLLMTRNQLCYFCPSAPCPLSLSQLSPFLSTKATALWSGEASDSSQMEKPSSPQQNIWGGAWEETAVEPYSPKAEGETPPQHGAL